MRVASASAVDPWYQRQMGRLLALAAAAGCGGRATPAGSIEPEAPALQGECRSRVLPGEGASSGPEQPFCAIAALWIGIPVEHATSVHHDELQPVLEASRKQLLGCYDRRADKSLSGTISVTFTISATGQVTAARGEGLDSPDVEKCAADAIRAIRFPKRKAQLQVVVAIMLEPNGGRPSDAERRN
jgi:hypothetical protein